MTDEETDISDDGEAQADPGIHNQVTHDHHAFLFGYRSADVDLRKLYPVSSQIWYFWKIYQDNVEPLIKVVHVPTTDILLREASKKLDSLSAGKQALVFAIFFAAVIALEPGEVCPPPALVSDHKWITELTYFVKRLRPTLVSISAIWLPSIGSQPSRLWQKPT